MKLWMLSDLHLEVAPINTALQFPNADVCVVAGDIMDDGVLPSIAWLAENIGRICQSCSWQATTSSTNPS